MNEILELNGKKYVGILNLNCGHCHLNNESCVADHDERCSDNNLAWKEVKMNNNNDLGGINGLIYTAQNGWEMAVDSREDETYCIVTAGDAYTVCGRYDKDDKHPSAWLEPPECFNAEPKPCEFKNGDKVLVSNSLEADRETWIKAYFSHATRDYVCVYLEGMTEWSSDGAVERWSFCQKA